MTLKKLIDNGLLLSCGMITVDDCTYSYCDYFSVADEMLNVYFGDDVLNFNLDNEVIFNGSSITVKNKSGRNYKLSFLSCSAIDPKKYAD